MERNGKKTLVYENRFSPGAVVRLVARLPSMYQGQAWFPSLGFYQLETKALGGIPRILANWRLAWDI